MTKKEAIEKAYIDLIGLVQYQEVKDYIGEDGYCLMMHHTPGIPNNHKALMYFGIPQDSFHKACREDGHYWRPKTLEGLEDNNGWISNSTPPEKQTDCIVLRQDNTVEVTTYFKGLGGWIDVEHSLGKNRIAHYIPITLPTKRPIHD